MSIFNGRIPWMEKPVQIIFSASASKDRGYNSNSLQTDQQLLEVQLNSNINYVRRFTGKPYSFSLSAKHCQNLKDRRIILTLPELAFNVSRFTPFQRKIQSDKKAFYEKIGFTYNVKAKATVSTYDSLLFKKENLEDILYGTIQSASVDAPFNLFKYFVVNPSFNYNERWYFKQEDRYFLGDTIQVGEDKVYQATASDFKNGFFGVRDFNFNTNVSTTVTGIYNFKSKRLKAIRHVIKPTVSYTFQPDFSKGTWNYFDTYVNEDSQAEVQYNRYEFLNSLYRTPVSGLKNLLNLNIRNNFDMKILNRKDTVESMKKVPLIEQFNLQTGYDFTADSLKIRPLAISAQSSLFNKLLTWNLGVNLDPYALNNKRQKIDQTYWNSNKRLLRFDNASLAVQMNFKGKDKSGEESTINYGTVNEREYIANNPMMFYDFNIPWSLSMGYNLNITKGIAGNIDSTVISTNVLTLSGHINVTPKWQINASTGYDIKNKDLTLTNIRVERDLHCWVLAFNWTAYPLTRQTYAIDLHVKSAILQELKLSRKQPPGTGSTVF
ncbi:MAG: putative LPS assembly protein LptD [Chitinophagales bacterium]